VPPSKTGDTVNPTLPTAKVPPATIVEEELEEEPELSGVEPEPPEIHALQAEMSKFQMPDPDAVSLKT
jgi:hypothetical protein